MELTIDTRSIADYRKFLAIKQLPSYGFRGSTALVPDEYAATLGLAVDNRTYADYVPSPFLFDYQAAIAAMAIRKKKYCVFADCGLGKSLIYFEWAKYVSRQIDDGQCVLIIDPLMVISQMLDEAAKWYPDLDIARVPSGQLGEWLATGKENIGITNYEAMTDIPQRGRLAGLILDESSMLKSHYGKWGTACLELGRGLRWKLAGSGTPAPNDRIEYANHAVFMDAFPSVNSFLARFFVNRGQTAERWEIKQHALRPFYRALSHWCIFLTNPATYGWKDNTEPLPPIIVHKHHIDLTHDQKTLSQNLTGTLIHHRAGGITSRGKMAQIAKGFHAGESIDTNKPSFIRKLVDSFGDESTIIWCLYNEEEKQMASMFPEAAVVSGNTPQSKREALIAEFKAGTRKLLISKPKVMGFGLNLQHVTRMVFSSLQDSYEAYYQAVKRANRYGSKEPLNVHIPFTDLEYPMIENVLRKAEMIQKDTEEQEIIFRENAYAG